MKRITIEVPEPGDEEQTLDVVDEAGNRCNGLCFDEMLGQVISMTYRPRDGGQPRYRMQPREAWEEEHARAVGKYRSTNT